MANGYGDYHAIRSIIDAVRVPYLYTIRSIRSTSNSFKLPLSLVPLPRLPFDDTSTFTLALPRRPYPDATPRHQRFVCLVLFVDSFALSVTVMFDMQIDLIALQYTILTMNLLLPQLYIVTSSHR